MLERVNNDRTVERMNENDARSCSSPSAFSPIVSPNRKTIRDECFANLTKQANKMQKRMVLPAGEELLRVGTIVLLEAPEVDRARLDNTQIVTVIVKVSSRGLYRVATQQGVLKPWYHGSSLVPRPESTPKNHGLEAILHKAQTYGLMGLPELSITQAVRGQSVVGGQGFKKCGCKGACDNNRCKCRAANVLCNSRCKCPGTCTNQEPRACEQQKAPEICTVEGEGDAEHAYATSVEDTAESSNDECLLSIKKKKNIQLHCMQLN